jgi:hypothetical protein
MRPAPTPLLYFVSLHVTLGMACTILRGVHACVRVCVCVCETSFVLVRQSCYNAFPPATSRLLTEQRRLPPPSRLGARISRTICWAGACPPASRRKMGVARPHQHQHKHKHQETGPDQQ